MRIFLAGFMLLLLCQCQSDEIVFADFIVLPQETFGLRIAVVHTIQADTIVKSQEYHYNEQGLLTDITQTLPESAWRITYHYAVFGVDQTETTNGEDRNVQAYSYHADGLLDEQRILEASYHADPLLTETRTYHHNAANEIEIVVSDAYRIDYTWLHQNIIQIETSSIGFGSVYPNSVVSYTYDDRHNPDLLLPLTGQSIMHSKNNPLQMITEPPSGSGEDPIVNTYSYTYHTAGFPTEVFRDGALEKVYVYE